MWEATGVETDPSLKVKAVRTGSVEDLRDYLRKKMGVGEGKELSNAEIEAYLDRIAGTPEYDAFLQQIRWIRFAPAKGWDDYTGINAILVRFIGEQIAEGDLLRSEVRMVDDYLEAEEKEAIRKGLPIAVSEIGELGFSGHEGDPLVQQLVGLNSLVEGSEEAGRKVTQKLLEKRAKGGKLFVAHATINGKPVLVGQGLLLENFDRFDATHPSLQGLGIGTRVTQARMADALGQGYLTFHLYVKKTNKNALQYQSGLLARSRDFIRERRKTVLEKWGITDGGEPFVTQEETTYPGDETREPMVRFTYHFVDQATEKAIEAKRSEARAEGPLGVDLRPMWIRKIRSGRVRNIMLTEDERPSYRPFYEIADEENRPIGGVTFDVQGKVLISSVKGIEAERSSVSLVGNVLFDQKTMKRLGTARVIVPQEKAVGPFVVKFNPFLGGKIVVNRTRWTPHDKTNCPFCKILFSQDKSEIAARMIGQMDLGQSGKWAGFYQYIAAEKEGHHLWIPYDDKTGKSEEREQKLTERDVRALIELPRRFKDTVSVFNDVGASVNHFHLQTLFVPESVRLPIEHFKQKTLLSAEKGVSLSYLEDYPQEAGAFVLEGEDSEVLTRRVYELTGRFYEHSIPVELVARRAAVYVFPVRRIQVDEFPNIMMGAVQRAGVFHFMNQEAYDRATSEAMERAIGKGSWPREEALEIARKRSEVRAQDIQAEIRREIRRSGKKLSAALKDPKKDFGMLIVGTHPESRLATEKVFGEAAGELYHPDVKRWVGVSPGRGSIANGVLAADESFAEQFGRDYDMDDLRRLDINQVAVILMSGLGTRFETISTPSAFRNKGLVTLPGGRTYLEQVLRQRFQQLDKSRRGVWIMSHDGVKMSASPVRLGSAGIQVIGHIVPSGDGIIEEHGMLLTDQTWKKGPQEIRFAAEKLSRQEILSLQDSGRLAPASYVGMSQADYFLSWEAFLWLRDEIKRIPQTDLGAGRMILRYNWLEHLFEPAYSTWEEYAKRYLEPQREKLTTEEFERLQLWLAHVFNIAKEARRRFGMEFVNRGPNAVYLHTNRPDQYYDLILRLRVDPNVQELLGVTAVGPGRGFRKDVEERFPGRIMDRTVIIDRSVRSEDIGPEAVILGNSVILAGSRIEGAVVNGFGKLIVPKGALVSSVIAPREGLAVEPKTTTTTYLVASKNSQGTSHEIVPVSLPTRTNLQGRANGKEVAELNIFPRDKEVTALPPSEKEERGEGRSLVELRESMDHSLVWTLFWEYLPGAVRRGDAEAHKIVEEIRSLIDQKPKGVPRSEVREEAKPSTAASSAVPSGLEEALTAKEELRLGQQLAQMLNRSEVRGRELEDKILKSVADVLRKMVVLGTGRSGGAYIIEVSPDKYDAAFIQGALANLTGDTQVVLFVDPKAAGAPKLTEEIRTVFAREIVGDRLVLEDLDPKVSWSLERFVQYEALKREIGVREIIQVVADRVARSQAPELVRAALIGAVPVAEGHIVVATERKLQIPGSQAVSVYALISRLVEEIAGLRETAKSA
jgi:hypothetical protein